ncbi:MAG TPA: hypothetical protein VLR46_01325 [Candidatus Dormibacteraeota bacterium]|jgi:H+/Cl- antiporter ClcA|nr:hypothetical protein [Candidatus Dormibacteraeota bacterium]
MNIGTQHFRVKSVPLGPALVTGAWAGFVPGLFIGAVLGAVISVGAGAILDWMRQLSFTTGIDQALLPFGDRIGFLQTLQDDWLVVVPATALIFGLLSAVIGMLTAAVVSASYGSLMQGLDVELEPTAEAHARRERRRRPRRRTDSAA